MGRIGKVVYIWWFTSCSAFKLTFLLDFDKKLIT
jgi:hypothetical protein